MNEQHSLPSVGVRSRNEVERACAALEAATGPRRPTRAGEGALSAYRWALGAAEVSPVTHTALSGPPRPEELCRELNAAARSIASADYSNLPCAYEQGVHDALAWVCGRTDRPA